jgi:predicted O-linked N-acetylglucosamine transferase (SPINDLY family)
VYIVNRVAASLLKAVNTPELITHRAEQYTELILQLVRDKQLRQATRARIEAARDSSTAPLFNTQQWVRDFEKCLLEVWRLHSAGLAPQHIDAQQLKDYANGSSDSTTEHNEL